jgi:hypothetical protein
MNEITVDGYRAMIPKSAAEAQGRPFISERIFILM